MDKFKTLFKEYREELLYKVQWPRFEELQDNTVIVLVASVIIAVVISLLDFSFREIVKLIYDLF
jgi:preprotein translocase subunit SecE